MAVLIDPKFDVMIRALRRQSRAETSPVALVLIGLLIVGLLGVWIVVGKSRQRYRRLPLFSGIGLLILGGYFGGLFAVNAVMHPDRSGLQAYEDLTPHVTIARTLRNGERATSDRDLPMTGSFD